MRSGGELSPKNTTTSPGLGFRPSQRLKRIVRYWHLFRARLGKYDVAVIDRELFDDPSLLMEDRFRRVVRSLVLEIDDGVFLRHSEKFTHLCRSADHVIAGN